jgi:holo-[acyl-carrier protein] synthase
VYVGVDMVTVAELTRLTERDWFNRHMFAETELTHAATLAPDRRAEFLAGRFAAKEAVLKLLGVGLFQGVRPCDIAVASGSSGAPQVALSGSAARTAERLNLTAVSVSITHKAGLAVAVALGS